MKIEHIPLLQIQLELHERPRDMARFREYLRTIFGGDVSEENDVPQLVPLIAMNPMGREHVADRLRQLLAPYLDSEHYPTCMAAIFGDEAARTLGYSPLGLSNYAGIAVALADYG
ncbi:MAG: hypothetical protein KDE19_08930 [Caldilineaceae bacterium]|nr:hypothetical protein [Caldilineaceae bacterium]